MLRAARSCRELGASCVLAAASHGMFAGDAAAFIADPALDEVIVTDTLWPFQFDQSEPDSKLTILPASHLFAEAVLRMHEGESVLEISEPSERKSLK